MYILLSSSKQAQDTHLLLVLTLVFLLKTTTIDKLLFSVVVRPNITKLSLQAEEIVTRLNKPKH